MAFETVFAFWITSMALAVAPGPDNLFVLSQSALYGRRSGLWVTAGLCSGLLFHTAAVALGLAALIQASSFAFTLVKFAGAGYLLYLAWGALRAALRDVPLGAANQSSTLVSPLSLYRRGVLMNITNPKVTLFFLAFLPQFIAPQGLPVFAQVGILGVVFMLGTFIVFGLIAFGAGQMGERLQQSATARRWLNVIAGTVFTALALRLLVADMEAS
ncbi:Homoserine/homoserine lactone efflux protein [BD1-7 clade bacterium]|uniref:Homoserine/homoserine lactone efflux protein n=1 Tax=BD1-7 clade bacterium TaxID=2029982 RepID=A0A5S9P1T1_9GAMM|nr:Homoserine/homoserine lactone efflux protein [BD1-7 clade bacterium]CAA0116375.1 Homoserine/homoserine lactone efflux protein [BD1-7 clade bacterium]CAA0120041.1 Homoserine/homoserine lactone efflux protein [BD1-7 clade bacterium]